MWSKSRFRAYPLSLFGIFPAVPNVTFLSPDPCDLSLGNLFSFQLKICFFKKPRIFKEFCDNHQTTSTSLWLLLSKCRTLCPPRFVCVVFGCHQSCVPSHTKPKSIFFSKNIFTKIIILGAKYD